MKKLLLKFLTIFLYVSVFFLDSLLAETTKAATIFSDNFNRPNTDTLGTNWNLFYGGQPAGIQDNEAYIDVGAGGLWGLYKVNNLNIQDQDVSVTFTHQNGDTALLARVVDINTRVTINYYQTGLLQIYEFYNGNRREITNSAPRAIVGERYTFRTRLVGNSIRVWVNGILYADDILNHTFSGSAGFGANDGYARVYFDNFIVTDTDDLTTPSNSPVPTIIATTTPTSTPLPTTTSTSLPTTTPTITPTVTPTATPSLPTLSVPSLKQYSIPWKNKIYDSTNRTIEEFGCALTSAVMILQYHGHTILPDTLNTWLKNQSDGYIRNGLVNWLAVSRYTKLHDSLTSPTLEYKRIEPTNVNLDDELNLNRPAILKEDGHFVVATGKTEASYLINDPGYNDRPTLESYGNSFLALNTFTPTHSDLSYMMFVVDEDINLSINDSSGQNVNLISYLEEPIKSIKDQNRKSGKTVKIYLFEKPANDKYELLLSGPKGNYELDSYLYTTTGKLTKNTFEGRLSGNDIDKFNIIFEGNNKIKENKKEKKQYWHQVFFELFKKWW